MLDEINRATPKLQAALFEAMAERFVTLGKDRYPLPRPFLVIATMNPHEGEDEMYRLPFGQRDRFAVCTGLGYPSSTASSSCSSGSAPTTRSRTSTRSSPRATS